MFSGCVIGIFNTFIILLGAGVALGGWWLTNNSVNTFPSVTVPPDNTVVDGVTLPTFDVDISSILNNAINGAAWPIVISGCVVFAFGIWGCVAFSCKIRWMAWLYIVLLLAIIIVEVIWGVASIIAYGKDQFPFFDAQITGEINKLFTGEAISDYDSAKYGEFYCMDLTKVDPAITNPPYFPGYYTNIFTEAINGANIDNLEKCTAPTAATTDCNALSDQCENNITLWLVRQVYFAGLCCLILAFIQLIVAILCMYSLHKMNAKKAAAREMS